MKIDILNGFVELEAENDYDVFSIGQLYSDMKKLKVTPQVRVVPEKNAFAKLSLKEEELIKYLIRKVDS